MNYLDNLLIAKQADDIQLPFFVPIKESDHVIVCEKILRFLPGKRLVVYGFWKDKPIVLKMFFNRNKALKHFNRELIGYKRLEQSDVLMPDLMYHEEDVAHNVGLLMYEYVQPLFNIDQLLQDRSQSEAILNWLRQVAKTLAQHHQIGFLQQDLHPNNFIVSGKGLHTIDIGRVKLKKLSKNTRLKNLAKFLAQLPFYCDVLFQRFYLAYLGAQHTLCVKKDVEKLLRFQKHYRVKREKRVLKKIFRSTSRYVKHRDFSARFICRREFSDAFQMFLKDPNKLMSLGHCLKSGNTCTLVRLNLADKDFVVKRYNIKNRSHGLKRLFQRSRASKCWENAHRLQLYGIKTPEPLAILERRLGLFCRESYLITQYVPGISLQDCFLSSVNNGEIGNENLAHDFMAMMHFFKSMRIAHGDMKANNFIVFDGCDANVDQSDQSDKNIYVTDLDSMKCYRMPYFFPRALRKDRERFLKNWLDVKHLHQFFSRYLNV